MQKQKNSENAEVNGVRQQGEHSIADREFLEELTLGNSQLLRKIINMYLQQTEELLIEIKAAIDAEDAETLSKASHKAVGASAACGMETIATPFRELEQMGKSGQLNNAERVLAFAQSLFTQISLECVEIIQELDS